MLHIAQISFFQPIMETMRGAGENLDPIFRRAGLAEFNLDRVTNHVPLDAFCSFLADVDQMYGADDLLDHYHPHMTLDLVPDFTEFIKSAPDLLTVCEAAAVNDSIVFSHEKAVFKIEGSRATFGSAFQNNGLPGHAHLDGLNLALMINSFRLFLGSQWDPLEVHVQQPDLGGIEHLLNDPGKTEVYFNRSYSGVVFPSALLTKSLENGSESPGATRDVCCGESLSKRIVNLLDSMDRSLIPNLEEMADLAGISGRTLQRLLADEGTTYSELVEKWRCRTAVDLLTHPRSSLKEIAQRLGYSDVANFSRAFTRWSNTTPGRYRDLFKQSD